jgi:hypothetical protein
MRTKVFLFAITLFFVISGCNSKKAETNDVRFDGYWHVKHGNGTILLDKNFNNVGKVLKPETFGETLAVEGSFPGLQVRNKGDIGNSGEEGIRYLLKWETLAHNQDQPRPESWPEPSRLLLYKVNYQQ